MKTDNMLAKAAIAMWLFFAGSWVWNAIKFTSCDFESDFRCEVIHGAGLFVPGLSIITVWFDTDD